MFKLFMSWGEFFVYELQTLIWNRQSWARDYFTASRKRQRDNAIEPQETEKIG